MCTLNFEKVASIWNQITNGVLVSLLLTMAFTSQPTQAMTIGDLIQESSKSFSEDSESFYDDSYELDEVDPYQPKPEKPQCGKSEFGWLVCAVYYEARNQTREGQYWVAQVILNRVHDRRWPNTIEGVVRQGESKRNRCQFSFMCDGKPERINPNNRVEMAAWQEATEIATIAMEDFYQEVQITCAHSYHADYVTSEKALKWFATLTRDEQVDSHIFFCD